MQESDSPSSEEEAETSDTEQEIRDSLQGAAAAESDKEAVRRRFSELGKKGVRAKKEVAAVNDENERLKQELTELKLAAEKEKIGKEKIENELKRVKASRELESLRSPSPIADPVERGIERLIRLKEYEVLSGSHDSPHVSATGVSDDRVAKLEAQIEAMRKEKVDEERFSRLKEEFESKYARTQEEELTEFDMPSGAINDKGEMIMQHVKNVPVSMLPALIAMGRQSLNQQKSTSVLVEAVNGLTAIIGRTQSNVGEIGKALLESPKSLPAPSGSSRNPQEELLAKANLVDYLPQKERGK